MLLALIGLFSALFFPMLGRSQGCTMNLKPEPALAPLLGTIAGVKLSFPRTKYGEAASIRYGNDSQWWGSNPARQYAMPTQDSPIRDFILTLNRSTWMPVSSSEDRDSFARGFHAYNDANLPSNCERWLEFVFSPQLYDELGGRLQPLYERQSKLFEPFVGSYVSGKNAFGLKQVAAAREGGGDLRKRALAQGVAEVFDTWYFDPTTWNTLIGCVHDTGSVTPMKLSCVHNFIVPELKSVVSARYMVMADVADWNLIEQQVRERISSYVI